MIEKGNSGISGCGVRASAGGVCASGACTCGMRPHAYAAFGAFVLALVCTLVCTCAVPASSFAAAQSITVYAGFEGGPYYKKGTVSAADIAGGSDGGRYNVARSTGKLQEARGTGLSLSAILDRAEVGSGNSIGEIRFGSDRVMPVRQKALTAKIDAFDTVIPYSVVSDEGMYYSDYASSFFGGGSTGGLSGRQVPAIISGNAVYRDVERSADDADTAVGAENPYNGNVLLYGLSQGNILNTECASLVGITQAIVVYTPESLPEIRIKPDEPISGKVNDTVTLKVTLETTLADKTIKDSMYEEYSVESTDRKVLDVKKSADKPREIIVTIRGSGTASLVFTYGKATVTLSGTGEAKEEEEEKPKDDDKPKKDRNDKEGSSGERGNGGDDGAGDGDNRTGSGVNAPTGTDNGTGTGGDQQLPQNTTDLNGGEEQIDIDNTPLVQDETGGTGEELAGMREGGSEGVAIKPPEKLTPKALAPEEQTPAPQVFKLEQEVQVQTQSDLPWWLWAVLLGLAVAGCAGRIGEFRRAVGA